MNDLNNAFLLAGYNPQLGGKGTFLNQINEISSLMLLRESDANGIPTLSSDDLGDADIYLT